MGSPQDVVNTLAKLGIRSEVKNLIIKVSRDDMLNVFCCSNEESSYQMALEYIREHFPASRHYWSGKDDNYLYLQS